MVELSANVRRLMARLGLTVDDVVRRSRLNPRTVKGILSGSRRRPHARTLHRLAAALEADVDELFQTAGSLAYRSIDRQTNPAVDQVLAAHPELVRHWTESDYDQLYGRFGVGGGLTPEGARAAIDTINRKRAVQEKVDLLLESSEAELLASLVDLLYHRVVITPPPKPQQSTCPRGNSTQNQTAPNVPL